MNTSLFDLLTDLINNGDSRNPAFVYLLDEYAKYHYVMVVLGGISVIALSILAGSQLNRLRRCSYFHLHVKTVSGKASLYLGAFSGFLALVLGLIVVGNLGNAVNPRPGFKNSLGMLGNPLAGTKSALLQQIYADWIRSESSSLPHYISKISDERISWQMPKAIICFVLFALFLYLSKIVWTPLVSGSLDSQKPNMYRSFALGILLSFICALLFIMTVANAQGSIAPVSLSLFFS